LDKQSAVFHTLGPRSPELVAHNNRLVNPATGLAPSFVRAPAGICPPSSNGPRR